MSNWDWQIDPPDDGEPPEAVCQWHDCGWYGDHKECVMDEEEGVPLCPECGRPMGGPLDTDAA